KVKKKNKNKKREMTKIKYQLKMNIPKLRERLRNRIGGLQNMESILSDLNQKSNKIKASLSDLESTSREQRGLKRQLNKLKKELEEQEGLFLGKKTEADKLVQYAKEASNGRFTMQ